MMLKHHEHAFGNKKYILLVIQTNTYFTGLLPLGRMLKQSNQYEPIFLFCGNYPTIQNDIETCRTDGLSLRLTKGVSSLFDSASAIDRPKTLQKSSLMLLWENFFINLWNAFKRIASQALRLASKSLSVYFSLKREISIYRQLLRNEHISLMVMAADNRSNQAVIVKSAHQENIPVVVLPQYMASSLEWLEYIQENPDYSCDKWRNKIAGWLYPRWTIAYKEKRLIALPSEQVLAREWLGIAPPLPWVLHSGFADAIALESEAVREFGVSLGLPPEKLFVTGSVVHDVMAEAMSKAHERGAELIKELDLESDRPILLSALPPDMIGGRLECDFKEYSALVDFWCRSLASVPNYNVAIVLHPSVRYEAMKYIEDWGVKITRKPIAAVIPLCRIFVASISATIQSAIACGVPVINYDVYRYRYVDYNDVAGVIKVEEKANFLEALQKLTSDPDYYSRVASLQAKQASKWGVIDGKASDRLLKLFETLSD